MFRLFVCVSEKFHTILQTQQTQCGIFIKIDSSPFSDHVTGQLPAAKHYRKAEPPPFKAGSFTPALRLGLRLKYCCLSNSRVHVTW